MIGRRGFSLAEILMSLSLFAVILVIALGVLEWALHGTLQHQSETREAFLAQGKLEELVQQPHPEVANATFPEPDAIFSWTSALATDPTGLLNVTVSVAGPAGSHFSLTSQRRVNLRGILFRSESQLYRGNEDYRRFTPVDSPIGIGQISIAPDGKTLAFVALHGSELQIYTCSLGEAAEPTLLFDCAGGAEEPSFSPDGKLLAFVSPQAENTEIRVYDLKSKQWIGRTRGYRDSSPAWFPDSEKLVFCRNKCSLMTDSEGIGKTLVDDSSGWNTTPSVAPDGSSIVFMSTRAGEPNIESINLASEKTTALTDSGYNTCPRFSPDGKRILFLSDKGGFSRLCSMNSDGSSGLILAENQNASEPAWIP
jgi:prepilin-type N-terminal cleavage/methylation domain-containing protein